MASCIIQHVWVTADLVGNQALFLRDRRQSTALYRCVEGPSVGTGLLIHLHTCSTRRNITHCLSRTLQLNNANGLFSDAAHRHHHGILYIPSVVLFWLNIQSNPVITTLVYATPCLYHQIICGTN